MQFQWDDNINQTNITKHGIDLLQASTVFKDTSAVVIEDTRHDYGEGRYQIIGATNPLGIVFVVFIERDGGIIRIISARKANKREKRLYQQNA